MATRLAEIDSHRSDGVHPVTVRRMLDVLYDNGPCLVVNKPPGILTQAPAGIDSMEVRVKEFYREREQKEGNIYLGLPHRLDRWTAHHTQRFPFGMDLIPDSNVQSSTLLRGEWEGQARETALSLTHWTIGAAAAAAAITAAVALRRRYRPVPPLAEPPPAVATGEAEAAPVVRTGL